MSGSMSGTVIGSGSDAIVLRMSEDAANGQDAQFTVNVDGQQIGGRQTITASHANGQDETFTFLGNYGPGQHTVTVTFANNFQMPGDPGDRNMYIDNVSYNGQTVSSTTSPIYESPLFPPNSDHDIWGNAVFSVNDTTAVPADAPSTPTTTPGAVSVGDGPDTLVLNMAEDEYQGDAQFTVSVDGVQVGGTQTTSAHLAEGQQQEFDVHGNWGPGDHTVTIDFTNNAMGEFYPGTDLAVDTTDRNVYVMGMKLDGGPAASGTPWELDSNGPHSFTVTAGSDQSGGASSGASGGSASAGTTTSSDNSSSTSTTASSGSSSDDGTGTSDTATVTSDSLSGSQSGSSSGMSFIEPATTDSTSASGSSDSTSSSGSSAGGSSDTTTTTVATLGGDSGQSTQDWTVPATSDSSGTSTDSGSSTGGSGHWSGHWSGGDHAWHGGWAAAHSQG